MSSSYVPAETEILFSKCVSLFYIPSMEHFLWFTGIFLGLHFEIASAVNDPSSRLWLSLCWGITEHLGSTYIPHFLFPSLEFFWHSPRLLWGTHAICNTQPSNKGELRPGDHIWLTGEESSWIIGETEYQSPTELANSTIHRGISFPIYSPISAPWITFKMNIL